MLVGKLYHTIGRQCLVIVWVDFIPDFLKRNNSNIDKTVVEVIFDIAPLLGFSQCSRQSATQIHQLCVCIPSAGFGLDCIRLPVFPLNFGVPLVNGSVPSK